MWNDTSPQTDVLLRGNLDNSERLFNLKSLTSELPHPPMEISNYQAPEFLSNFPAPREKEEFEVKVPLILKHPSYQPQV